MRWTEEQLKEFEAKRGARPPAGHGNVLKAKAEAVAEARKAIDSIRLVGFETPPGVNNLYISVGRKRVISPKYRDWRKTAEKNLRAQWNASAKIDGPVRITIMVGKRDRRRADIDGRAKAMIDTLVHCGVLDDDNFSCVFEVITRWSFGISFTEVMIERMDAAPLNLLNEPKKPTKKRSPRHAKQ